MPLSASKFVFVWCLIPSHLRVIYETYSFIVQWLHMHQNGHENIWLISVIRKIICYRKLTGFSVSPQTFYKE
jgi:hypothetical protein